jgi:enoyl-[acyl-carrier-protein] reductase (NADH)
MTIRGAIAPARVTIMEFSVAPKEFSVAPSLHGKRGLVVGIANEASIAAGCAHAFAAAGASIAATYLNEKAQPHVRAVTDSLGCKLLLACDVRIPGQLEAAFERIGADWGNWTSCCMRSLSPPRTICTAAW